VNVYEFTLNELKRQLRKDENLTREQWDIFAQQQSLFSSITIQAHMSVDSWEEVKDKAFDSFYEKAITRKIRKLRKKLNESIEKYGIDSKQVRRYSDEIDILINSYYKYEKDEMLNRKFYEKGNMMGEAYNESYENLCNLTIDLRQFPTVAVWNDYAKRTNCLNNVSMSYISGLNWHKLESKVINEINNKKI